MEFQYFMGNQLTLINLRTNDRVTIEVSPNMTIDEVTQILIEHGIVRKEETVVYYKIKEDGNMLPLNATVAGDLLALQATGTPIGIMAQRIQGDNCIHILHNVGRSLGFKAGRDLVYGTFMWAGDNQQVYVASVRCQQGERLPEIYICPYPSYVKIYQRLRITTPNRVVFREGLGMICAVFGILMNRRLMNSYNYITVI